MKQFYLIIPPLFFIADRVIKYFASSISFGDGFVKIAIFENYAGAFSLPIAGTVYNILGVMLLIIFIILFFKTLKNKTAYSPQLTAYSLIIFGGLSNLLDRLYFGYVIDYIQIADRSFFNIADIMLVAGVIILLSATFRSRFLKSV